MGATTRIKPLDRSFELALRDDLSAKGRSRQLAEFAREEIAKAREENRQALGAEPASTVFVDGREGAPLESVQPDGTITARFELLDETLGWIRDQLLKAAPVRTGRFRKSFVLLADDVEIGMDGPFVDAREYTFTNTQPYARRIEGDGRRQPTSRQARSGVFEVVAGLANQRFGNVAKITFGWQPLRDLAGSSLETWANKTGSRQRKHQGAGHRHDWLRRQPSIIVRTGSWRARG